MKDFKEETKKFIEDFHIIFSNYIHTVETIEEALSFQSNLKEVSKYIDNINEIVEDRLYELFEVDK
jgi:hypothetical protein